MPVVVEWSPETNLPPVATPRITPAPNAIEGDSLTLALNYYDPNGDPEQGSLVYWYRDGGRISAYDGLLTIPAGITIIGQFWYAMVRPRDNLGLWGDWVMSNIVWIIGGPVSGYRNPGSYTVATDRHPV